MHNTPSAAILILSLAFWLLLSPALSAAPPAEYAAERQAFMQEMITKHGMDPAFLQRTVGAAKYKQKIIDAMNRPAEGKPWRDYRPIFVTPKRTRGGVKFWKKNAATLERAERIYGVPPEIIVAIIGVETFYGGNTGYYRVIDALSTLGFGYPKRAKFFRQQLEEFLQLVGEEPVDPMTAKGSYAGAMGMPQFIPGSYRSYAVDFDHDGKRDLLNNLQDVIGSVAAYLDRHGWQRGAAVTSEAKGASEIHQSYVEAGMKPSFTLQQMASAGITPLRTHSQTNLTSLIRLEGDHGTEYWLGLDNFYVITRYNHSNLYAMAVTQLSEAIVKLYKGQ